MDPNETLTVIRHCVAIIETADRESEEYTDAALSLAEFTRNLDEWLARGGFLPDAWKR